MRKYTKKSHKMNYKMKSERNTNTELTKQTTV